MPQSRRSQPCPPPSGPFLGVWTLTTRGPSQRSDGFSSPPSLPLVLLLPRRVQHSRVCCCGVVLAPGTICPLLLGAFPQAALLRPSLSLSGPPAAPHSPKTLARAALLLASGRAQTRCVVQQPQLGAFFLLCFSDFLSPCCPLVGALAWRGGGGVHSWTPGPGLCWSVTVLPALSFKGHKAGSGPCVPRAGHPWPHLPSPACCPWQGAGPPAWPGQVTMGCVVCREDR